MSEEKTWGRYSKWGNKKETIPEKGGGVVFEETVSNPDTLENSLST